MLQIENAHRTHMVSLERHNLPFDKLVKKWRAITTRCALQLLDSGEIRRRSRAARGACVVVSDVVRVPYDVLLCVVRVMSRRHAESDWLDQI